LATERVELENTITKATSVHYQTNQDPQHNLQTLQDTRIVSQEKLTEYLAENYQRYGARLEFITDKSQEGNQFVKASIVLRVLYAVIVTVL